MLVRVLRTAAIVVLVVATVTAIGALLVPRLAGWTSYIVTSGSMEPTFGAGSLVLVAPAGADDIRGGDIITFQAKGGLTTHRVIKAARATNEDGQAVQVFTTKGDANEEADPTLLDPRNVVGQARFAIPLAGYAVVFLRTPVGLGLVTALFLAVALTGNSRRSSSSTDEQTDDVHTGELALS